MKFIQEKKIETGINISEYPGYVLSLPDSETPVFVNENVWHSVQEESYTSLKNPSAYPEKAHLKLFDMLNYSSKPYYDFLNEKFCDQFICKSNNSQYRQPTMKSNPVIVTNKNEEKFVNGPDLARRLIRLKNSRNEDVVMLNILEDSSTNLKEPHQGILKKKQIQDCPECQSQAVKREKLVVDSPKPQITIPKKRKMKKNSKIKKESVNVNPSPETIKPRPELLIGNKVVELFPFKLGAKKREKRIKRVKKASAKNEHHA